MALTVLTLPVGPSLALWYRPSLLPPYPWDPDDSLSNLLALGLALLGGAADVLGKLGR